MQKQGEKEHVLICGVLHKIGVNGFVFMKVNGEWMRSMKKADEVRPLLDLNIKNKCFDSKFKVRYESHTKRS